MLMLTTSSTRNTKRPSVPACGFKRGFMSCGTQASAAELAVVNYKNKNNMVDAGGRTINEQQLAELNSQLVLAQSQTAEARARPIAFSRSLPAIRPTRQSMRLSLTR